MGWALVVSRHSSMPINLSIYLSIKIDMCIVACCCIVGLFFSIRVFFHAQCGFQAFTHFALPCTCLRRDGACGADMELTIIVLKSRPLS